eukprot:UN16523
MRSYDPKHTPPMISSHSHYFRALNAPKRANMKILKIKIREILLKNCCFELLIAPNVSN